MAVLFPAWDPLLPRALRSTEPAAAAAAVSPPHGAHWFSVLRDPPTALEAAHPIGGSTGSSTRFVETPISIGCSSGGPCGFLAFSIGSYIPCLLVRDAAGLELVRYWSIPHALKRLLTHCLALLPEQRSPASANAMTIGGLWLI